MKATCTAYVPEDLISRFCTLLTYICLHIPAVSGFWLGRQWCTEEVKCALGQADSTVMAGGGVCGGWRLSAQVSNIQLDLEIRIAVCVSCTWA